MMPEPPDKATEREMPEDVAEAWAEVYIDVAEKLNADEQSANTTVNDKPKDTTLKGDSQCPSTSPAKPT